MILTNCDGGTVFELRVLGYQFPEITHDRYDSNWLMVQVAVTTRVASWSVQDPCMLTWEGHWLLNWLIDVCSGVPVPSAMSFMESNLEFDVVQQASRRIRLRIALSDELRAPATTAEDEAGCEVQIELTPSAICEAANELRDQLRLFPVRGYAPWNCRPGWRGRSPASCALCNPELTEGADVLHSEFQ